MNKEAIVKKILNLSNKALKKGEIPIGSIILHEDKIISYAYNLKESKRNVLYHAELLAITEASKAMKDWRLNNCILYTTLFPCPMCASAITQSRIKKVVYLFDSRNSSEKEISLNILKNVELELFKVNNTILDDFFKKIRN